MKKSKYWTHDNDDSMRFYFHIPNTKIYGITYPDCNEYIKRKEDEYGDYFSVSFDPNYLSIQKFCNDVTEYVERVYNVNVVVIGLKTNSIGIKDSKGILHDIDLERVIAPKWVIEQYYKNSTPVKNDKVIFKNHMSENLKMLMDALEDPMDD